MSGLITFPVVWAEVICCKVTWPVSGSTWTSAICAEIEVSWAFSALLLFFFFNDTATTEIYTLSLHDALPICGRPRGRARETFRRGAARHGGPRSEEHTSELQSLRHLVCRLLLEKKKHTP